MQRRPPTDMPEAIRQQCVALAAVADPDDSQRRLAEKMPELSVLQVQRRIQAMERELGLAPAAPGERGGGRFASDGTRQNVGPYRRAGAVARQWRRFRAEDCL